MLWRRNLKSEKPAESATLRICHLADVHLGYRRYSRLTKNGFNQREVDVNLAFRESVDRIIALKPALTVIAGDLFHAVRPSNAVLAFCFRELKRLVQNGSPVVIVAGNHETPRRQDSGSPLRLLAEISGVFVAESSFQKFTFPALDLAVHCLPHSALMQLAECDLRADERYKHNVLVAHAQIDHKWISDFGGVNLALRELSPHEFDYIALGHVHLVSEVALNASYSGSIEHTSLNIWSEGSTNKGFLEVELPGARRTFHSLTSPRQLADIERLDASGLDREELMQALRNRIKGVPGGIEGKIVRLEVANVNREIQRQIDLREIRKWRASALSLNLELRAPDTGPVRQMNRSASQGRLEEELVRFCREWQFTNSRADNAEALLVNYLKELEREDEAVKS